MQKVHIGLVSAPNAGEEGALHYFTVNLSAGCKKGAYWELPSMVGWVALVPFVKKPYCSGALEGGWVGLLQNGRNLCIGVLMWRVHCTTSLLGETH